MTTFLVCVLAALLAAGVWRVHHGHWGRAVVVVVGTMLGSLVLRGALGALLAGLDGTDAVPLGGSGMMLLTFLAWWTAPNDTTML